jgi:hypothetical protein
MRVLQKTGEEKRGEGTAGRAGVGKKRNRIFLTYIDHKALKSHDPKK